jgi:glutamate dehydrogenase/leucine dehydrogenase
VKQQLEAFEKKPPLVVFHWHDDKTEAQGWAVINSLRGGACGGGTRMRKGCTEPEVLALAKTMEIKFTVSGPPIGGAKSGIDFDPNDPGKRGVLERWFGVVKPLLRHYYGTGGDMNVDSNTEVLPITAAVGCHYYEGIIEGHYHPGEKKKAEIKDRMWRGVSLPVVDPALTPEPGRRYEVADLVTGWGVAESVRHFYDIYGGALRGKRCIIQGWGNVAAPSAYYLAQEGVKIVGIIDRVGGLINPEGFSFEEVRELVGRKKGNFLPAEELLAFDAVNDQIWSVGAEVFIPGAASRLVTRDQLRQMLSHGLEVISSGANVPFADRQIFYGPIAEFADNACAVIPDFIANAGMARTYAYLLESGRALVDRAIFEDVSRRMAEALMKTHEANPSKKRLTETAYGIALADLQN